MPQHDYTITHEDATNGQAFREAINAALQALASNNMGPTAPVPTFPMMFWPDTTTKIMKQRDATNSYWISRWPLDSSVTHVFVSESNSPYTAPATILVINVNCTTANILINMPPITSLQLGQRIIINRVDNSVHTVTLVAYDPGGGGLWDTFDDGGSTLLSPAGTVMELALGFDHQWLTVNKYTKPK